MRTPLPVDRRRLSSLALALALALALGSCVAPAPPPALRQEAVPAATAASPAPMAATPRVDFDAQVRPILVSRCSPCHFAGGTMYEKLPFDRAATIHHLGEKLFTRIKDEREQELLRSFLAQGPAAP